MQSKLEQEDNRYIKFYYGRFLSSLDVKAMKTSEVGAYALLLFNSIDQNIRGHLPDDDETLRKITGLGPKTWAESKQRILKKFKKSAKGYYNEMMLKVLTDNLEAAAKLPSESKELHPLQQYIAKFPRISKLYDQQLTYKQCEMLMTQFSLKYLKEKIMAMENYNKVYPSVFLTLQSWCIRDMKK